MLEWIIPIGSALWLGILTSISPCPLTTNIAAISYVGKKVDKPFAVLISGLLYTAGRTLTYLVLGIVLANSIVSVPLASHILQKYMNMFLGPLLIIVGMMLLELISFNFSGISFAESVHKKADKLGLWGAGFLGILFSLSFCPTSAALFFGSLLPLAIKEQSVFVLPAIYGIATGIPVLFFAILLASGTKKIAKVFDKIVSFEKWARKITGALFIGVGIYYSFIYIF